MTFIAASRSYVPKREFSQHGEDGVLEYLFRVLGVTNRYCVEFGAGDGTSLSNTANLRLHHGWTGLLLDRDPGDAAVLPALLTAESLNQVFAEHGVPPEFDLLSIDVDGNDYWLWRALEYRPRVVVIEFNTNFGPDVSCTIAYNPDHAWDGTRYYGASLLALTRLAASKGYALVGREWANAFFVRSELICPNVPAVCVADILPEAEADHRVDRRKRPWITV